MTEAFVFDSLRTPRGRGKPNGSLHEISPTRLVSTLLDALRERNPELDPSAIDDVVLGTVEAHGDQGGTVARTAILASGFGESVPGLQLSRYCGSGLEAVNQAAARVRSGWDELVLAGGVESMSRVPMGSGGDPSYSDPDISSTIGFVPQGIGADLIATIDGFSRRDVDEFAITSQERAAKAWADGRFDRSVIPVRDHNGDIVLNRDEHMRPGTTLEDLTALQPAFANMGASHGYDAIALSKYPAVDAIDHVHTAGNSSGIVDGAALILVGSKEAGIANGLAPRARILSVGVVGSEPTIMLTGPGPASRKALAKAGMGIDDIDLIEINEAFASVALRLIKDLSVDHGITNVNGGAIAMGHPLGATGAMLMGILVDELVRQDLTTGLVTLCTGGGMGVATVIERV